jgi:hypothetical protein
MDMAYCRGEIKMKIEKALNLIGDAHLKGCSILYFNKLKLMGFDHAPASRGVHHSYDGGLRDHTEEMLDIGLHIHFQFPNVNRDHLIVALVFHDAGKTQLYIKSNDHYEHNPFICNKDHSFVPIDDWDYLGYNMPEEVKLAILGHMGGWSVTGVYPDRLLDTIVCSADLISSRLKGDWVKSNKV